MGYTFDCNGCDREGENPALMAQFNKRTFLETEFGHQLQEIGYELGDTITLCTVCTWELIEERP